MSLVVADDGGTVTVTDAVLSQIVIQAAEAVEGARVRRPKRHLEIAIADGRARVELELAVAYGRVLPDVARGVQQHVAEALTRMCGVEVDAVDIAVEELDR
jgi:uncharacterized alkaline shock family protein YloU